MAMKEQQRSAHRSMQGKEVDMHKLIMQNEMTVAVGNAKMNARGDELGAGGQVIRKREDVLKEYYQSHPNAAPDEVIAKAAAAPAPTAVIEQPVEETAIAKLKSTKD
jgi:hypothetical protein